MQHSGEFLFLLGLLFFGLSSCSSRKPEQQLPTTQPDISGRITQLTMTNTFRIMVEADPSDSTTTAKASILVPAEAWIAQRNGDVIERKTLQEGDSVSVWFDGPVLMSYPMQAGAKIVVRER